MKENRRKETKRDGDGEDMEEPPPQVVSRFVICKFLHWNDEWFCGL